MKKVKIILILVMVLSGSTFGMYNPQTGRFLTQDPLGVVPWSITNIFHKKTQYSDGVNIYQYVISKPNMKIDPLGLDAPGCDVYPDSMENVCALECCAEHDRCYDIHGCDWTSWLPCVGSGACNQCNHNVFGCMVNALSHCPGDDPNRDNFYCNQCHSYFNGSILEHIINNHLGNWP